MKSLYLKSGYIDIPGILSLELPFNFIVGGRGTGKTYTSLLTVKNENIKFLFMRRTQTQADLINKPDFSPFKSINIDEGCAIYSIPITKYNAAFYNCVESDGKMKPEGQPLGYTCALSTISNLRGFDAQDVDLMIYDEFIPEKHERPLKNEHLALLNAYETVNRNREIKGKKPLQLLALANANDIANPVFLGLNLVSKAEKMRRNHQEISIDRKRGIGLFILDASPISEMKKDTALYKLTAGSEFADMALSNDFMGVVSDNIKKRPIKEYKPVVSVGEICVYQHKSNNTLYVSLLTSGSPQNYAVTDIDLQRFRRGFSWVWMEYLRNNIFFEDILCEVLLTKYFS